MSGPAICFCLDCRPRQSPRVLVRRACRFWHRDDQHVALSEDGVTLFLCATRSNGKDMGTGEKLEKEGRGELIFALPLLGPSGVGRKGEQTTKCDGHSDGHCMMGDDILQSVNIRIYWCPRYNARSRTARGHHKPTRWRLKETLSLFSSL